MATKKVHFTNAGTYHCLRRNMNKEKILLIFQAMKMLKNSHLISFNTDYKGRTEIAGAYKMKTFAIVECVEYEVILTLRQGENGVVYYDHKAIEIKKTAHTTESEKSQSAIVKSGFISSCKDTKKSLSSKKIDKKYGLSMPFYVQEQEKKEIQPSSNSISNKIKAFQGRNFELFNIENPDLSTF